MATVNKNMQLLIHECFGNYVNTSQSQKIFNFINLLNKKYQQRKIEILLTFDMIITLNTRS